MTKYRCEPCEKDFDSEESYKQHNLSKHVTTGGKARKPIKRGTLFGIAIVFIVILVASYIVLSKPSYIPLTPDRDNTKGSGSIQVVEFSDFQCPVCRAAEPEMRKILTQFGNNISLTYKQFPIVDRHPYAFKSAEASECAADQGKFWEYHDKLFDNDGLDIKSLKGYAEDLGLNVQNFTKCLDSGVMGSRITKDMDSGQSKGIRGTPTFFVNGKMAEGVMNVDEFRQLAGI